MKKKILSIATMFAIVLLAVLNINITEKNNQANEFSLIHLNVAFANNAEYGGWNNFWQGQGFYLDERQDSRKCPSSTTTTTGVSFPLEGQPVTIGETFTQTNPPDRYEIICPAGSENCTQVPC